MLNNNKKVIIIIVVITVCSAVMIPNNAICFRQRVTLQPPLKEHSVYYNILSQRGDSCLKTMERPGFLSVVCVKHSYSLSERSIIVLNIF